MRLSTTLVVFACVFVAAACASSRRIDGSSAAAFERSVAMLQNDLPSRKRADFEVALAVTWMRAAALDAGDVDADGDTDYFDARAMADNAGDLLAAIQRGDFVSSIEDYKTGTVAASYFERLDGLGYAEVVELAGNLDIGPSVADLKRHVSQTACSSWQGAARPPPLGNTSRIRRCD
jgi:hypothetical protein